MAKRYELSDAAWDLVADLFVESRRNGRPRADDRLMLNGVLWVLCSGAAWRDMPEHFGPWSTVYQWFRDWRNRGAFDLVLKRLHIRLSEQGLIDLETWMIDSTAVRATLFGPGMRWCGLIVRRSGFSVHASQITLNGARMKVLKGSRKFSCEGGSLWQVRG